MTNGNERPGTFGAVHHEAEHRAPAAGDVVGRGFLVLPHRGQRRVLQAAVGLALDPQFVRLTPSQKNWVSREDDGRIMASASRSSGTAGLSASLGRNFMMRQSISATSSSPTCQMMCWLMK